MKNGGFRERVGWLLKGFGQHVDDINPPKLLHCVVNSLYAHALRLQSSPIPRLTDGLERQGFDEMHGAPFVDGLVWRDPKTMPLAVDSVRFVGEPVDVVLSGARA
ncbi:MAG: hypothetical protein QXO30_04620 [Candidatus Caldarchaeum sp.]